MGKEEKISGGNSEGRMMGEEEKVCGGEKEGRGGEDMIGGEKVRHRRLDTSVLLFHSSNFLA